MRINRIAAVTVGAGFLYLLIPMAINTTNSIEWIALPPPLTFSVLQIAAAAAVILSSNALSTKRWVLAFGWMLCVVLLSFLAYTTITYCP
jgi:dolichyl-phosphate-mannose--protein O-mannosyl transferase